MLGLPNFVLYLISGAIGAFTISAGRWFGQKYIANFPDIPLILSRLVDWGKPEPERVARIMGSYLHLTLGALWALLFGLLVERQFFFVEFTPVSGVMFGVLPWLFLMLVLLPLARSRFGKVKITGYYWVIAFLLHLLYGLVVGFLLSIFIPQQF